jgi:hypothetical protein
MKPHYYLMKSKKILRLEAGETFEELSPMVREMALDPAELVCMDQEQANWRVAIFRDEILELSEFQEWMKDAILFEDEEEFDLIAN